MFLKGTLDKIGAQADFEKIGDYKTAPNQLTQNDIHACASGDDGVADRDMYEQLVRGIAESRKKKVEDVRALIDEGPFLARDAHRAAWSTRSPMKISSTTTAPSAGAALWKGSRTAHARRACCGAALRASPSSTSRGIINSGDSGFDPLNGEVAGSAGLVKAIQSARADDDVRAIVVRIDSPGGSSIASDVIWRELTVTKNEKPVASARGLDVRSCRVGRLLRRDGGAADRGAARHTDWIDRHLRRKVHNRRDLRKTRRQHRVGHHRTQCRHRIARAPVHGQRAGRSFAHRSSDFYNGFIQKVAASRKMPVERVDQLAQGRVWTGAQAREHGLVDALGGLDRAIALAKERAGISPDTEVEVVTYPARKSLAELLIEELSGSGNDREIERNAVDDVRVADG